MVKTMVKNHNLMIKIRQCFPWHRHGSSVMAKTSRSSGDRATGRVNAVGAMMGVMGLVFLGKSSPETMVFDHGFYPLVMSK